MKQKLRGTGFLLVQIFVENISIVVFVKANKNKFSSADFIAADPVFSICCVHEVLL